MSKQKKSAAPAKTAEATKGGEIKLNGKTVKSVDELKNGLLLVTFTDGTTCIVVKGSIDGKLPVGGTKVTPDEDDEEDEDE